MFEKLIIELTTILSNLDKSINIPAIKAEDLSEQPEVL